MNCPYLKRTCAPVDVASDLHATPDAWLHRHDHRRCRPSGMLWWHPDDELLDRHIDPPLHMYARFPLQAKWNYPAWRIVASSLLLVRTSRIQAEPAAAALFGAVGAQVRDLPAAADTGVLRAICGPLGLVGPRVRYLENLGRLWPSRNSAIPDADFVAELLGCGPYVVDAYRTFALGDPPPAEAIADKVLRLHVEMRYQHYA